MPFLEPGDVHDETYLHLRDDCHVFAVESRRHVEELWSNAAPFVDPKLPLRARRLFHPAYWELLLAASLVDAALPVAPNNQRRYRSKGPDIQVGITPVTAWIEATAVTPGQGVDQVREGGNRVRTVPDGSIKLRLLAAIHEKKTKHDHYVRTGLVSADEPFVIAINDALVPSAFLELRVPRIVRCVFPFGDEVLEVDLAKHSITGSHHEHSDSVSKSSGASVPTDLFERPDYAGISAVLHSAAEVWNPGSVLDAGFILVHNPLATSPLPHGFLPRGREYWKESGELKCKMHCAPLARD